MNKLLIIFLALLLTACSGGDTETTENPTPEATSGMPDAEEEPPLALSCSRNPNSNNIGVGVTATSVFSFNRPTNANGTLRASCGAILLQTQSVSVPTSRDFDQNVPILCSGNTLEVELTTATLSASCTWNVN